MKIVASDPLDIEQEVERLLTVFGSPSDKPGAALWFETREQALIDIFDRCGFPAQRAAVINREGTDTEVDAIFEMKIDGASKRVAIEIKNSAQPESIARGIYQARRLRHAGRFDRVLLIVAGEVPEPERQRAEAEEIGYLDLLGISDLRSWLWKHAPALQSSPVATDPTCAQLIRATMRAVAERLARFPDEISTLEWRDMERVLREVFEGMGFDTTLTRGGKDGGFDLELVTFGDAGREVYLVEVKHWTDQKPGKSHIRKLVRVTARAEATKGILLSTSGFAPSIYEGLAEAERSTVAVGGRDKIVGLCTTYYRLGEQLWQPDSSLSTQLLSGLR